MISFEGKSLWKTFKEVNVEENSSTIVHEIPKANFSKFDLNKVVLKVQFKNETSNYFFVKAKELKLSKPDIQIRIIDEETLEVSSDILAKERFFFRLKMKCFLRRIILIYCLMKNESLKPQNWL